MQTAPTITVTHADAMMLLLWAIRLVGKHETSKYTDVGQRYLGLIYGRLAEQLTVEERAEVEGIAWKVAPVMMETVRRWDG